MKKSFLKLFFGVAMLVLAFLACNALGTGSLLEDDSASNDSAWDTSSDADSSVEYSNKALKFSLNKDFFFVWSTPNNEDYQNIHIEVTARNNSTNSTGAFVIYN